MRRSRRAWRSSRSQGGRALAHFLRLGRSRGVVSGTYSGIAMTLDGVLAVVLPLVWSLFE